MAKGTVNKLILVGRLGVDPEMKYLPSGTAIANFTVATNERMKNSDGDYQDHTDWHRIVAFGRTAEFAGEYLRKASLVYVEGRVQNRSWEDKEGVKKYITEVICNSLQMLGSKSDSDSGGEKKTDHPEKSEHPEKPKDEKPEKEVATPAPDDDEDDLPF